MSNKTTKQPDETSQTVLHKKGYRTSSRKAKRYYGFSLIELLVVVGIMGTLAAVAIPAYNQYRKNAAEGAFSTTQTNIARAFSACVAVNDFTSCDTLAEINMNCPDCDPAVTMRPLFCVDMETDIGGETYKGCVSSNSGTGTVARTININTCYDDGGAIMVGLVTCTTGDDSSTEIGCETQSSPLVRCTTATECTDAGHDYCIGGKTGECDPTAATCG